MPRNPLLIRPAHALLGLALSPMLLLAEPDAEVLKLGEAQYQTCALCHGPDGMGVKAGDVMMAPGLAESPYIKGDYPELLGAIILKGIKKESNDYLQVMLPLETVLDDENLAAVMTYVRHTYGSKDETITASQVAGWRKEYADYQMLSRSELASLEIDLQPKPKLLEDLTYKVYKGSWKKLPNFTELEPIKTGKLEDNLLDLAVGADVGGGVGIVYNATLNMPKTAKVDFFLGGDDGVALFIDGESFMEDDGIHPIRVKNKSIKLEKGLHSIELRYFDGGGDRRLSLVANSDKLGGNVPLSSYVDNRLPKKAGPPPEPILVQPENPDEAVIYRAFLATSNPRAIGVGYPGEVNLCWDADVMNLASVWRGPFMDARKHWTNRGQGDQNPMGYDVVQTGDGLPIQVLESLEETWTPQSKAELLIDRDRPPSERTSMRSFNVTHEDYQFLGYRLDEKRFPTFRYQYQDVNVEDSFAPYDVHAEVGQGSQALQRTVRFEGNAPEQAYFRIADSGSLEEKNGWYDVSGPVKLRVEGAEPIVRPAGKGKELLIPLAGEQEFKVTYWWPVPVIKDPTAQ